MKTHSSHPDGPPPRPDTLSARRRVVRAALALGATLVGASVLFAIAADLPGAADRIRPLSEVVDAGLDWLRALGTTQLVAGGLLVAVVYALVAAWLSHRRQRAGA